MDSNQNPIRADDRRHEDWLIKEQRLTIRAMILTMAVCLAPFLALPFGFNAALTVLGVGLLFTAWLCWSGANQVGVASRGKLRTMGTMNFVIGLFVFGIVLIRVM